MVAGEGMGIVQHCVNNQTIIQLCLYSPKAERSLLCPLFKKFGINQILA